MAILNQFVINILNLQVYIIANSIKRFTVYLSLPWPNGQPPFSALNSYVVFIGVGVVMLPFFVVVAVMKIGNYSNDGHKLGNQRKSNETNNIYQNIRMPATEIRRKKRFHVLRLIWRHSVPIAPFLHMLAALCFLFPRILMEAQLIKHGFLGKGQQSLIIIEVHSGRSSVSDRNPAFKQRSKS